MKTIYCRTKNICFSFHFFNIQLNPTTTTSISWSRSFARRLAGGSSKLFYYFQLFPLNYRESKFTQWKKIIFDIT